MNLADMREQITIEKAVVDVDAYGNRQNSYSFYCKRWTYANMKTGKEEFKGGHTSEKETLCFVIRYDSETKLITSGTYRVIFHDKVYNIVTVDNFKFRNNTITLTCEEEYDERETSKDSK